MCPLHKTRHPTAVISTTNFFRRPYPVNFLSFFATFLPLSVCLVSHATVWRQMKLRQRSTPCPGDCSYCFPGGSASIWSIRTCLLQNSNPQRMRSLRWWAIWRYTVYVFVIVYSFPALFNQRMMLNAVPANLYSKFRWDARIAAPYVQLSNVSRVTFVSSVFILLRATPGCRSQMAMRVF